MLRSLVLKWVAINTVLLGLQSLAHGATLRVPSQYATINNALDASVLGDTVLVAPGTYTDYEIRGGSFPNIACAFLKDGVALLSESGAEATVLDMQGFSTIGSENIVYGKELNSGTTVVEGFTLTGTPAGHEAAFVVDGGLVTFRGCIVRDVDALDTTCGGIIGLNNDLSVFDCTFTNCKGAGGGGIFVTDAGLYVEGCTFIDNPSRPISVVADNDANTFRCEIVDCVFLRNGNSTTGDGHIELFQLGGGVIVQNCYFEDNQEVGGGGALSIGQGSGGLVENCVFWKNKTLAPSSSGGALSFGSFGGGVVRGCTFSENNAGALQVIGGAAILFLGGAFTLENNVVANSGDGGPAVRVSSGASITSSCNIFWNNLEGDTFGFVPSSTDRVIDPEFCDATAGDFTVRDTSPCLPPNSNGCGLIGAFGQGCGSVSIEPRSWGLIKGGYR